MNKVLSTYVCSLNIFLFFIFSSSNLLHSFLETQQLNFKFFVMIIKWIDHEFSGYFLFDIQVNFHLVLQVNLICFPFYLLMKKKI
jgi:hypothetical protein